MKRLGLYFHFPFCKSKCTYCDFYSITDHSDMNRYLDALMLQCEDYSAVASDYAVDTVFFGGGTPSIVPVKKLLELIDSMYENFHITLDAEFTMEVNPATVQLSALKKLHRAGVNRLSLGCQSACDEELKILGRAHDFEGFEDTFEMVRKVGFDNVNVDIMYGIPNQTMDSFKATLESIVKHSPEHISLYNLKLEEGTPLAAQADTLLLPDEDTEFEMYEYAIDYLAENGYDQYEISNFAKPGYECKHNLRYWHCSEYLGLGSGAHSYFRDNRFSFIKDVKSFVEGVESPDVEIKLTDENYIIKPNERVGEYIMLAMRLTKGLNAVEFSRLFGLDFAKMYENLLPVYIENGFMRETSVGYAFTTKGMYVSNYILSTMLDFSSDIDKNIANGTDK